MADAAALHQEISVLWARIVIDSAQRGEPWSTLDIRPDYVESAQNLAAYLALRRHDLRDLQRALMALGLSSLGRLESRVLPTLAAVRAALAALAGLSREPTPDEDEFFKGEKLLADRAAQLFGHIAGARAIALLVTCPSEAADDPSFMLELARRGVEAVRINCAHDDADQWAKMVDHVHAAGERTGRRMRIFMDLGGPKLRTGQIRAAHDEKRAHLGDLIALVAPGELDRAHKKSADFIIECSLPQAISLSRENHRLSIDDGKIEAKVERTQDGVVFARVIRCEENGVKLKPEKGLNFPDAELAVPALTDKDRKDLRFVARHADAIEFSFVQSAEDVAMLQEALAEIRPDDWRELALILKIETPRAIRNLPDMIVRAAARQPTALMIARGDLAMEIGFTRLAEMQEELLWIGEAAQIPVIWATQVLETLVKTGAPSRGEMTDAAMAARAECVMLNKGPYLFDAIAKLDRLLGRMDDNVHKKTPQLRPLRSW